MKVFAIALLAASLTALAVFGMLAMDHGKDGHSGCIGAMASGTTCPQAADPLDLVLFHLHTFQRFSTALPVPGELTVAVLFALFSVLAFLVKQNTGVTTCPERSTPVLEQYLSVGSGPLAYRIRQNDWFAARSHMYPSAA